MSPLCPPAQSSKSLTRPSMNKRENIIYISKEKY